MAVPTSSQMIERIAGLGSDRLSVILSDSDTLLAMTSHHQMGLTVESWYSCVIKLLKIS